MTSTWTRLINWLWSWASSGEGVAWISERACSDCALGTRTARQCVTRRPQWLCRLLGGSRKASSVTCMDTVPTLDGRVVLDVGSTDSPECSLSLQHNYRRPGPGGSHNCAGAWRACEYFLSHLVSPLVSVVPLAPCGWTC